MTEKEWVRLGGKDGVYLVEGEDYTVDRKTGRITINDGGWAKCEVVAMPREEREEK